MPARTAMQAAPPPDNTRGAVEHLKKPGGFSYSGPDCSGAPLDAALLHALPNGAAHHAQQLSVRPDCDARLGLREGDGNGQPDVGVYDGCAQAISRSVPAYTPVLLPSKKGAPPTRMHPSRRGAKQQPPFYLIASSRCLTSIAPLARPVSTAPSSTQRFLVSGPAILADHAPAHALRPFAPHVH